MSFRLLFRSRRPRPAHVLLLQAAAFLVPVLAQAQSSGTVTGIIMDAETNAPLKSATVRLRDAADSTAKPLGNITGEDGAFSIRNVPFGRKHTLEVLYLGYDRHVVEDILLTSGKPELMVGRILLRPVSISTAGTEVTAPREQVRVMADKTVYGVENNTSYTATNVSELLGQIPSVEVDQDGKISLRGNDNVTIMMNDRPLTMPADQRNKFLQSLPADMVKDIEIRTNPGAQFDAKYDGGIINIVTRRTMSDLFGGNVNLGGDSRPGVNAGGSLYYNGEDLNASLGGGGSYGNNSGSSSSLRLNYRDAIERRDEGSGTSTSTSSSYHGYGQVDYRFTENDLASISFNLNQWSSDYSSNGTHIFQDINNAVVGRYYDTSGPSGGVGNEGGYNTASALLRHTFSPDHKLSLDFSYNSNNYSGGHDYRTSYFLANGNQDSLRSSRRNSSYQHRSTSLITTLDYENPISESLKLTFGGKNEINILDNRTSVSNRDKVTGEFVLDTLQTNHYLPRNDIYAVYGEAAFMPLQGISVQAGLRVEQATVSAKYASGREIISRDYLNLFPSGSLAYNITEQQSLTASYRRSVALPDIDALNPTRVKWSDFYEQSGNPDLEPEFTHTMELSYNTFWGMGNMVTIAPYYATTEGSIEQSQELVDGVTRSSSANFNGTYSVGSELSVAMRPLSWFNFRVSGNVFRKVNRGGTTPGDIHSEASGYSGNASFGADLMEGLNLSMNLFFNKPAAVGASRRSAQTYMSFALRQRLLQNKLNITLRVNDPFNLQRWENWYDAPDFHTESTSKWSSRFVGLNISYTFGTTPRMETHTKEKTETKGGGSGGAGGQGGGN